MAAGLIPGLSLIETGLNIASPLLKPVAGAVGELTANIITNFSKSIDSGNDIQQINQYPIQPQQGPRY